LTITRTNQTFLKKSTTIAKIHAAGARNGENAWMKEIIAVRGVSGWHQARATNLYPHTNVGRKQCSGHFCKITHVGYLKTPCDLSVN
jgi:hypothetical protein